MALVPASAPAPKERLALSSGKLSLMMRRPSWRISSRQGSPVIKAHLEHLAGHGQIVLYDQAVEYLIENGIPIPDHSPPFRPPEKDCRTCRLGRCPGREQDLIPPLRKYVTAGQEPMVRLQAVPVRQPGPFPAPDHGNRWVGRLIPSSGNGQSSSPS